ncbi:Suf-domain-containing protein, partial [Clavulina sp. PMI_390]
EPVESSVVSTEPPQSNIERLSTKLKEHPDDGAIWQIYINLVDQSGDIDLIESAYERLVEAFPNQATAQITYLSHYLSRANFPKAEALFARFLRPSPSVDLWKFYLIYIRRVNPNPNEANSRNTIKKAYEFALNHVGQDKDAGDIWKDYIDFLKSTEPATTWDAQQRMDALRSAYHRAVVIPVENVETLWRDLDAFENSLNKITAKKFLGDLSPSYMTARTSLRDLRRLMEPLSIPPIKLPSGTAAASLPLTLPARPTWIGDSDRNLTQAWKAYLKWEESNPLDADEATLYARVSSAYRKAVMRMRFFPEIWYMAYNHLNNNAKQDEATTLLKQGMDANPSSFLLHFAYAELCESLHQVQEAQGAFENLIKSLHTQLESIEAGIATEVAAARDSVPQTDGANPELALERDEREKAVVDRHTKELDVMRGELGVVWIMWMRFARRAQGLRPARGIFTQARKDKFCPWSVYEAAALMEYHASKSGDVSTKIFELGMKQFGTDVDFVIRYLGFLISINDDINGRALFESAIGNFTGEKARPLWERWARYEYNFGDFAATQKLKARITEAYPNDPPLKHFAQRYAYHGVDAIAGHDLGFAVRNKPQPPGRGATTSTNAAGTSQQPPTAPAADRERERERATAPVPPPRRSSPDPRTRRREPSPPPAKRFKPSSPPPPARRNDRPLASRDRERWDENTPRRVASPAQGGLALREPLPTSLHWFIGLLPPASSFDGPIFRTEDMMELLKHGNIPPPSSQGSVSRPRSPPPPR